MFGRIDIISGEQEQEVLELIKSYYQKESIGYPGDAHQLDEDAAVLSSKILYYATQLVMYREHSEDTLDNLFPKFNRPKTASAIISADVCLRFLPSVLKYLEQIDIEDELIPILKVILKDWHYSGLISEVNMEVEDLEIIINDECLSKLYIDRVIEYKRKNIGQMEVLKPLVLSALGNYINEFWKDFNLTI